MFTNTQGHNINLSKLGTVEQIRKQYRRNAGYTYQKVTQSVNAKTNHKPKIQ